MDIKKILLVDDDANIRKLAKMSLERVGKWNVDVSESGEQALEMLKVDMPDLILLDLMMPGLDGLATLQRLKSEPTTASIPVILMTAKVQCANMDEYVSMGALGVIIKPFDPLHLPDEIRNLLK